MKQLNLFEDNGESNPLILPANILPKLGLRWGVSQSRAARLVLVVVNLNLTDFHGIKRLDHKSNQFQDAFDTFMLHAMLRVVDHRFDLRPISPEEIVLFDWIEDYLYEIKQYQKSIQVVWHEDAGP